MTSAPGGLNYRESGRGDPVMLLDWSPWDTPALAESLSSRYRVISLDPPGHARELPNEGEVVTAVEQVAKSAGLTTYTLVGTSLGARVSFHLAQSSPQAVASLVLVSPSFIEVIDAEAWDSPELAAETMLAHPDEGAPLPPAERTGFLWRLTEQWAAADQNPAARLHDVACATLVVLGQEDRLVSREAGGVWKERVPNCNVCYVYDAGHAVGVDRPEALANVVLDFVERRETFIVESRNSLINP